MLLRDCDVCQYTGDLNCAVWRIVVHDYDFVRDLLEHIPYFGNKFSEVFSFVPSCRYNRYTVKRHNSTSRPKFRIRQQLDTESFTICHVGKAAKKLKPQSTRHALFPLHLTCGKLRP